jgi:hypothetical protein
MPSNPDSVICFRDSKLAITYDKYFKRNFRHGAGKEDLLRYRRLVSQSMPIINPEDLICVYKVMPPISRSLVIDLLSDDNLIVKIKGWSEIEWLAVVDNFEMLKGVKYQTDLVE